MILRRNWAREEAHTPGRTAPAAEACEGCDKTEQTQNTLFSNNTKRHQKARSADSAELFPRRNDQVQAQIIVEL